MNDVRQRFLIVQLAMFNADVLASVQHVADSNADSPCRSIVDQCAARIVAATPPTPSTVNQSLFFGMAYLAFVWLRESLTDEQVRSALASSRMKTAWSGITWTGPRNLDQDWQKLRIVRNALSHGNVAIEEPFVFVFWDQDKYRKPKEERPTYLRIDSAGLGCLATQFYFAVSDVIYS